MTTVTVRRNSTREAQFVIDDSDPSEVEFRALATAREYDFCSAREGESSYEIVGREWSDDLRHAVCCAADDTALYNVIHEAFSSDASALNNAGVSEQVNFLLNRGWSEQEILMALRNAP